ncbi:MAG: TolC family protein [Janthinobacterium lividum]
MMRHYQLASLTIALSACLAGLNAGAQVGGTANHAASLSRDTAHLQEAENQSLHTGEDLPAPELLAEAMERPAMSLLQFEQSAEVGSPVMKQADAARERSEQTARQAGLPPNPTIGYSGEHIRGGSYHGGEQGAFVQQTVVMGGKLGLRRDVYREQAAADRIGIEEQRYRVRGDVQQAFYRALATQETVAVRRKMLQLAADSVETAHQLANLGQADAPDVLQAEVELEQAKMDYVDAQREYLQRFAVLAALANQPSLPVSPLTGQLDQIPNLDGDAAVAKVLAESPAIQRAQQEIAVAQAKLKQSKREPVPDLTVQAGEWYSGERLDGINKPAGWMGFAQAGVELPLWNRNQGNTGAAKADVARAEAEVTRTQRSLKMQAEPMAQRYLNARFQTERYRTQLIPRAQRAFDLYSMKYQQMAAAYPQVLLSQRTLFNLQIAYVRSLEMAWMNVVGLQNYTLSGGLDESVQAGTSNSLPMRPGGGE